MTIKFQKVRGTDTILDRVQDNIQAALSDMDAYIATSITTSTTNIYNSLIQTINNISPSDSSTVLYASGSLIANNSVLGSWAPDNDTTEHVMVITLAHCGPPTNGAAYFVTMAGIARFSPVPNTSFIMSQVNSASGQINTIGANLALILPGAGDPSVQIVVSGDNVHAYSWRSVIKRYVL